MTKKTSNKSVNHDAVVLGRLRGKTKGTRKKPHKADKFPPAVSLGKMGGLVGGPARAKVLNAKKRSAIASKGGKARQAAAKKTKKGKS
jgi:hypothetical protein